MNKQEYAAYLRSDDWKQKRDAKRKESSRCAICGCREQLDVHHLNYRNIYDVELTDLRVLCRTCHMLAHKLLRTGRIRYRKDSHHSRFHFTKQEVLYERRCLELPIYKSGNADHDPYSTEPTSYIDGLLKRGKSVNGGISKKQFKALGLTWPLRSGWREELEKRGVTQDQGRRFLYLRDKHVFIMRTRKATPT